MPKSHEERFDRLEAIIEKGFAAIAQDIAELKTDVASIKSELSEIRSRLDALEESVRGVSGFAKEIDHLLERVGAIEQHLGIRRDLAAQ